MRKDLEVWRVWLATGRTCVGGKDEVLKLRKFEVIDRNRWKSFSKKFND